MDAKENFPKWKWNEYQQVGTDYASEAEVAIYDRRMRQSRVFVPARRKFPHEHAVLVQSYAVCVCEYIDLADITRRVLADIHGR